MKALNWILNNAWPPLLSSPFQVQMRRAMTGILKRKFEEVEASSSPCSSLRESDDEVSCSESGDSSDSVNPSTSGPFTRESPPPFCIHSAGPNAAPIDSEIDVIASSGAKNKGRGAESVFFNQDVEEQSETA